MGTALAIGKGPVISLTSSISGFTSTEDWRCNENHRYKPN